MEKITKKNYVKNRERYILKECVNKKVLHLGCCDWPFTQIRYKNKSLLFLLIEKVSKKQLGLDNNKRTISYLHKKGYKNIRFFDLNKNNKIDFKPDVIIFGETLEHLMNLEIALSNIKKVMTKNSKLIITVPNATGFLRFLGNLLGKVKEHPDHKVSFTQGSLNSLLKYNNFLVEKILVSDNLNLNKKCFQRKRIKRNISKKIILFFYRNIRRMVVYIFPLFSECLIFVIKKK